MGTYWSAQEGPIASWMNATPKVVLSTTADFDVTTWATSSLAAGDGVENVRRLKESDGGGLVTFGGARTVRSRVTADLVDEYWLKVSPAKTAKAGQCSPTRSDADHSHCAARGSYPSGVITAIYAKA